MIQCSRRRKGRPGRGLPFEQHNNEWKIRRLHPLVERFVVFIDLPVAEAALSNQQNERGRLRDFLGKLRRPGTAGAQVRGGEEDARGGVLALDGGLEPLRQRLIRRVIAEKPALHSKHRGGLSSPAERSRSGGAERKRGRGTARSAVEGACSMEARPHRRRPYHDPSGGSCLPAFAGWRDRRSARRAFLLYPHPQKISINEQIFSSICLALPALPFRPSTRSAV